MNINELPPELLVRIFSNIGGFTQETRLEHVCSRWRQIAPVNWKKTKTCPKLNDLKTLGLVLNRCGEWLEELWLYNLNFQIDEKLVKQMAKWMKCLKHLKLSNCQLDGPAADSINNLFGQQLYSFILYGMPYSPKLRRFIENESSKLEHLSLILSFDYSEGILPTKLPNNLKSFSLTWDEFDEDSSVHLLNMARDCKNLKCLHLEMDTLLPNMIVAIGNIKSLVYLNLTFNIITDQLALEYIICRELPNLKALNIDGYCSEETVSNICQARPDLVHLNVFAQHAFKIPDFLNSLTLRIHWGVGAGQFIPEFLFNQQNKSIQLLDIRFCSLVFPSSPNFIEELFGQFPKLKTIHCKMPATIADLTSFFSSIKEHHFKNGRKITIYFHDIGILQYTHYKYILPDDLPQFNAGWRPNMNNVKIWY